MIKLPVGINGRHWLTAILLCSAAPAFGQAMGNEVWLGQIGGLNVMSIDQSGRGNQAGADNIAYRINQNGTGNQLIVSQFGYNNHIGASRDIGYLAGVNQIGAMNEAELKQSTSATNSAGSNIVGALFQKSTELHQVPANYLRIEQRAGDGSDGASGHFIGAIFQNQTDIAQSENRIAIVQIQGGVEQGNKIGFVEQIGSANNADLQQQNESNVISYLAQRGQGNSAVVDQGQFSGQIGGNFVEYLHQFGYANQANVTMMGANNTLQRLLQFNIHLGASAKGNLATITLDSGDNGSTGNGGVGDFRYQQTRSVGAAQSEVVQLGEANRASIGISGADNQFGVRQFGYDNDAQISISAKQGLQAQRNETSHFQDGTDNYLSHTVTGSDNLGAIVQAGSFNRLALGQDGDRNITSVRIYGDGINKDGLGFSGFVTALIPATLKPGALQQTGNDNSLDFDVSGNNSLFAAVQQGTGNNVVALVTGASNQLAVVQIGNYNAASVSQIGMMNSFVLIQGKI